MNLKPAFVVLALSLPLAGCGNKGPLILPQSPPADEASLAPSMPPMGDVTVPVDDATAPVEGVPEEGAPPPPPPPPPAADADAVVPVPPPVGDDGDG